MNSGARVAGGKVHNEERAVVDAQGEAITVEDVEHVEDVAGAADEAEHLGDVLRVAGPRYLSSSPTFAHCWGWRRLEVMACSSGVTGTSIPGSVRRRFGGPVD
ncbi:hypothetical protein [Kitasatospora sp. NPDC059327]|uniref:hypothetical protein n=1 Tax=Kitasatospora sp. NPDC059327 TaxID=3346803 RepID=UPI003693A8CF